MITETTHERWRDSIIDSDPFDEDGTQMVSLYVENIVQLMYLLRKFNGCAPEISCHLTYDGLSVTTVLDDRSNSNTALILRDAEDGEKSMAVALREVLNIATTALTGIRLEP